MQNGISLVKPSGLRIHEILERSSRQRCRTVLDQILAELFYRSRPIGIDEGIRCAHGDCRGLRSQSQLNFVFRRERRAYFQRFGDRSKPFLINLDLIDAEWQALCHRIAGVIGEELSAILICFAQQIDFGLHAKAERVGDLQAQFAAIALAQCHGASEKHE